MKFTDGQILQALGEWVRVGTTPLHWAIYDLIHTFLFPIAFLGSVLFFLLGLIHIIDNLDRPSREGVTRKTPLAFPLLLALLVGVDSLRDSANLREVVIPEIVQMVDSGLIRTEVSEDRLCMQRQRQDLCLEGKKGQRLKALVEREKSDRGE